MRSKRGQSQCQKEGSKYLKAASERYPVSGLLARFLGGMWQLQEDVGSQGAETPSRGKRTGEKLRMAQNANDC